MGKCLFIFKFWGKCLFILGKDNRLKFNFWRLFMQSIAYYLKVVNQKARNTCTILVYKYRLVKLATIISNTDAVPNVGISLNKNVLFSFCLLVLVFLWGRGSLRRN